MVLEEDLDERRPRGDGALDQRLRQRIFDVLLQELVASREATVLLQDGDYCDRFARLPLRLTFCIAEVFQQQH